MKHAGRAARLAQAERLAEASDDAGGDDISREAMTTKLMRLARLAEAKGDLSAARAALMDAAKLNGLLVERAETVTTLYDVSDKVMTEEEWADKFGDGKPTQ